MDNMENIENVESVQNVQSTENVQKNPSGIGKLILIIVLCAVLLASLTIAVLAGMGILFSESEPEATVPPTTEEPVAETTEPLNLKSYTVDDETALAAAGNLVSNVGDYELTNSKLQVIYRMGIYDFISANSYWLAYMNVDFSKPLDQQLYAAQTNQSWQEVLLDYSMKTWHQYAALNMAAKEAGFELDETGQKYLADLDQNITDMVKDSGYDDLQKLLAEQVGAGVTAEDYKEYFVVSYTAMRYIEHLEKELDLSEEVLSKYFDENPDNFNGITKDSGNVVDVRHILIKPQGGTEGEDGTVTYSEEEWETCRQTAQDILDQWKAGEATEDSFAALAKEKTEDGGSVENGGLYTEVTEGMMVPEFNDWIFDETRAYADTDLVKTTYGYHIMYFVKAQPAWLAEAKYAYLADAATKAITEATDKWQMEIDYDAICISQASIG